MSIRRTFFLVILLMIALARASNTRVQAGDPDNIQRVLDLIGS
jgi:hypothetical protein